MPSAPPDDTDLPPLPTLPLGRYRHHKGGQYEVLGVVRHSESRAPMVLYRALYGAQGLWVRPFEMFTETVEHQGRRQPRFAPCEAAGEPAGATATAPGRLRHATCSCGQLQAEVQGEPLRVSVCHCLACQRRTGSVFGAQARFPRAAVTLRGESRGYVRTGDEGGRVHFHFCPHCGATVAYAPEDLPDILAIPVGAFADPQFPAPGVSVYEERMHPWVSIPGEVQHIP